IAREVFPGVETIADFDAAVAPNWDWYGRPEQIWRPGPETYTAYVAGRGFGKLLDLDTPIATTRGWKRNGDLQVGDLVFGPDGQPTRVLATFDRVPERAWRVRFSDGTHIDAGGEHLWCTWTHRDRKAWNRGQDRAGPLPTRWWAWRKLDRYGRPTGVGPAVRDTDAIVATERHGWRRDRNHSIPTTAPIELPAAPLPLDPWVLGCWLGDGTTAGASITCHMDDVPHVLERLHAAGIDADVREHQDRTPTVRMRGVRVVLRALGVLGRKHVPAAYLWASPAQRLALLRGLMDSDGYASPSSVEFCSTDLDLAAAVLQLARSLGERPTIAESRATLRGEDHGPRWRVSWRPARHNPFALARKASRVPMKHGRQASRLFHRMIVAVEPIEPRPMRCITVDHESHLYLAGEGLIPTHNTDTGAHATDYVGLHPELCGGRPA
ncbi:MAG: LAGLIDADG family homing endonuclease, partial [Phycicoccus sp.]